MTIAWGRRARGPLGAVLALALAPWAATSSAPATPAAHVTGPDGAWSGTHALSDNLAYHAAQATSLGQGDAGPVSRSRHDVAVSSPKGTRIWSVSALSDHGLPVAAEKAYRRAAAQIAQSDPGCRLPWTLLAGIGRVESDHGRYDGARLGADGLSRPRIIGVQLNGAGPVAAIRDTDDGRLDRDAVWDRAVGPMQFIPATWESAARDGDGDGRRSPHDLDDAAAAAAAYLCSGSGSLLDLGAREAAIYRYNQDEYYVALVQAFEVGYRTGVFVMPPAPPSDADVAERRRTRRAARLAAVQEARRERRERRSAVSSRRQTVSATERTPAPKPSPKPAAKPSPSTSPAPSPKPSAKPSPSPTTAPKPYQASGTFSTCEGGYCLDGTLLDLGSLAQADQTAAGDYDLDQAVESNGDEVAGLLDTQVQLVVVELADGRLGVHSVNGTAVG